MPNFKRTNSKIYSKTTKQDTPSTLFWKQFREPVLIKEFGPVDYIDFSPIEPHHFAVTSSLKVNVYNPITKLVQKNFSRFKESAYGGNFRSDGLLLCAGCEEAQVKLFEVVSRNTLRIFKGHSAAVHRCFFTTDKTHIASFSDDKTVVLWDIPTEQRLHSFEEHTDYIRAGATSPVSPNIIISGGYDNQIKMYDSRMKCVAFGIDHGAPVESVLFLPSGGIFCTAGGNEVKVWDSFAGGKLLAKLNNHHKTVTCLSVTKDGKYLFSGGLDRQAKIYEFASLEVVHTISYPNSILSLNVSPNQDTLVAGMVDGLVSVIKRETFKNYKKEKNIVKKIKYSSDRHLSKIADLKVFETKPVAFAKFDNYLRKFEYSKALDCVLIPYITNKYPEVTVSLLQELIRRDGLKRAIAGRDDKSLLSFLKFINKNIGIGSYTRILIEVAHKFLDIYENNCDLLSSEVCKLVELISIKVHEEEKLTEQLLYLQGAIDLLMSVDLKNAESYNEPSLTPSQNAQNKFIVNLN